ncbi:hypothetical protein ISP15_17645, partial [Dyella jejuensis]
MAGADRDTVRALEDIAVQRLIGALRADQRVALKALLGLRSAVGDGGEVDVVTGTHCQRVTGVQVARLTVHVVTRRQHGTAAGRERGDRVLGGRLAVHPRALALGAAGCVEVEVVPGDELRIATGGEGAGGGGEIVAGGQAQVLTRAERGVIE